MFLEIPFESDCMLLAILCLSFLAFSSLAKIGNCIYIYICMVMYSLTPSFSLKVFICSS